MEKIYIEDKITNLSKLVGVDINAAFEILIKFGVMSRVCGDYNRGKVVEILIALLMNEPLPGNIKGSDFEDFEVKTVKVKYNKTDYNKKYPIPCGDPPICKFDTRDRHFESSNVWDKTYSIIFVLYHQDLIVDVRVFDGNNYREQLKKDFYTLFYGGSDWRQKWGRNNQILVLKSGWDRVQFKSSSVGAYSSSISGGEIVHIDDQIGYLKELLMDGLILWKKNSDNYSYGSRY